MYFRRVLAGLDLELRDLTSEEFVPAAARRVFERALEVAAAQRGELHLCAVIDGLDLTTTPASPQQVALFGDLLAERLDMLAEEAREAGIECEFCLVGGDAGKELLRLANDWRGWDVSQGRVGQPSGDPPRLAKELVGLDDSTHPTDSVIGRIGQPRDELTASLIVIGASAHAHPLGPTAWTLLRSAKIPIWIERPEARSPKPEANDDGDEPPHVLIADDLTPRSADRLMTVIGSHLWRDAKCWLLHVVGPDRWPEAWQAGISADELTRRQAVCVESARLALHEHLSPTDHRTMTYGTLVQVANGNLTDSLTSLVNEWQIDLVICGLGPQSLTFLPHLNCSMLVFPLTSDL